MSQSTHVVISVRQVSNEEHSLHAFSRVEHPGSVMTFHSQQVAHDYFCSYTYSESMLLHRSARH